MEEPVDIASVSLYNVPMSAKVQEKPEYAKGVRSGYDTQGSHGRWRLKNGAYTTKARAMDSYEKEHQMAEGPFG